MTPTTISPAVLQQQFLASWFDRKNNIVQLATIKSNPTGAGLGKPNPTVQVSIQGSALAIQIVNLSDLIQQDPYAPNGLSVDGNGNFQYHTYESFSNRYSRLNLPAFGG